MLPICDKEKEILDSVKQNDITIVTADTGSGKSTQIPQFLYKAGYNVIVTEPRRISAVSLANRVAEEIGQEGVIGYHTGFESNCGDSTKIVFCKSTSSGNESSMLSDTVGRDEYGRRLVSNFYVKQEQSLTNPYIEVSSHYQIKKAKNFALAFWFDPAVDVVHLFGLDIPENESFVTVYSIHVPVGSVLLS